MISVVGPNVFEAICRFDRYGVADGHMNAITEAYHWHLSLDRFGFLRSHDRTHRRSGRRVLYFTLAETPASEPFLHIYAYRKQGEEFARDQETHFAAAHRELGVGVVLSADRGVS